MEAQYKTSIWKNAIIPPIWKHNIKPVYVNMLWYPHKNENCAGTPMLTNYSIIFEKCAGTVKYIDSKLWKNALVLSNAILPEDYFRTNQ